ncbi:MAG: FtsW/RodA/SpoVE family cell cycle protein [Propionicimonas sp.]|nr:FtsW/RodA/SpoVE family cell cycle protein [Propionicimonas sp.]
MADVVVYRKRRGVEAFMLVLALAVGLGGYFLTHLNLENRLPEGWPWAVGISVGLAAAAHLVVRWRIPYADPLILPMMVLLNGLGVAMIHRLDLGSNKAMHSAELQLTWTAVAVAGFIAVIVLLKDYQVLRAFPYLTFLVGLVILLLPLVPGLARANNGAQIWIQIGQYSFQPAEIAKIVLSIAFAAYLVEKKDVLALAGGKLGPIVLPRPRDLGPILIMWLASMAILVFQKDLGTSLLFFGLFVIMLYIATERSGWAVLGAALFLVGAVAAATVFSHVQVRVSSWLDPFSDYDRNYPVIQGQVGLAWGGLFGTGWGLGRPNLTPLAKSDFIAAAIGEELGLVGLTAVMMVYALITTRGLRAALGAREPFGKLLAAGLSFVFAIQVFAILGGVTRLLPLTGLTTPFMSQGGSALLANWVMMALLLVVTHHVRKPVVGVPADPVTSLADESTVVVAVGAAANGDETEAADVPVAAVPAGPADAFRGNIFAPPDDAVTEAIAGPDSATAPIRRTQP